MRTKVLLSLLLLTGLGLSARPAHAEDADVAVGGVFLFRIHATVNGMTPKERADIVDTRLQDILSAPKLVPADIKLVSTNKNTAKITVKDALLITVLKEDGAANGVTTLKQAQMWVESLRKNLPRINAKPNPNNEGK